MVHYQYDLSGRAQLFVAFFFFFNDTATTEIYTLSLHDALPISQETPIGYVPAKNGLTLDGVKISNEALSELLRVRSEEHTSELQSQSNLVCRLLLEKKKRTRDHYPQSANKHTTEHDHHRMSTSS